MAPILVPLVLLATGILLLLSCREQLMAGALQLLIGALPAIVALLVLARFGGARWLWLMLAKIVALTAAIAATLVGIGRAAGRRTPTEAEGPAFVRVVSASGDCRTVLVDAGNDQIRQGDRLRLRGPSLRGVVRPLLVLNVTTGRRWIAAGPVRLVLATSAMALLPLSARGVCT